ncbi:MAG: EamA family transporter [Chloroflexi bacterium]|nr:EamA family transporter [Chloroflexota bacterium]
MSYLLFGSGIKDVPVTVVATLTLFEPLTAALLGILLLGEPVSLPILLGMGLVLGGLSLLAFDDAAH